MKSADLDLGNAGKKEMLFELNRISVVKNRVKG